MSSYRRLRLQRGGATWIEWLVSACVPLSVGGYVAYRNGYDMGIFKGLTNALSTWSMEIILHLLQGGVWLLKFFPTMDIPYADAVAGKGVSVFSMVYQIAATVNIFFPVVELFSMFSMIVFAMFIFIVVKMVLKLIPTIG